MQAYSDPTRENETYALPDLEIFQITQSDLDHGDWNDWTGDNAINEPGWYYWYCFPGCMPDSDPIGPYENADAALEAARCS